MQWTKPDFVEIPLGMEVTAYVNTDAPSGGKDQGSIPHKDANQVRSAHEGASSLNPDR